MTANRSVLLIHGMSSSRRTWWRVGPDLEARGWDVRAVDLAGHGGRSIGAVRSVEALAEDVVSQHPDGTTLVVGHSLGAIVALELVATVPAYARGVLLEDPPALIGRRAAGEAAEDIAREVMRARSDPHSAITAILAGHPTWSRRDARSMLEGRLMTDPLIAQLPPGDLTWNLPALVAASPVPVALVATLGRESALLEPDRSEVLRARARPQRGASAAAARAGDRDPGKSPPAPGRASQMGGRRRRVRRLPALSLPSGVSSRCVPV